MNISPPVSFIIPTFGRAATLRDSINCALRQNYPDFEVIVATQDAEPPDFLFEIARQNPQTLRVIRLRVPNVNAARNAAARAARGAILLSIDDDVLFETDYASKHASRYSDELVGFVTSLTRGTLTETNEDILKANAQLLGLTSVPFDGDFVAIKWAPTCAASYRREAVERAGWFDPYFTGGVADDTDIAVRIGAAGYRGYLDTTIRLTHLAVQTGGFATRDPHRTDAKRLNDQRMRLYFAVKNRAIIGWADTLKLFGEVLRATMSVCRQRNRWLGPFIAPWTFIKLAAQAVRDAHRRTGVQ